jgi:5-methylcytosine-specific restriction enzyme A
MPRAPKAEGHAGRPVRWRTRTASSRATGTRAARSLRAEALERDGHQCTRLVEGRRCSLPADEVDHVVPIHKGGASVLANLASLCGSHHREKTQREAAGARQKRA